MIHDTLQSNNKNSPLISIVMPVFNAQDFIFNSLQSVLQQTYKNIEIICVDDGSIDKSAEFIKYLMCDDDRIRLIQIENHGQGYARNLALSEANGKYVLFLDADDFLEKVALDVIVTRAEEDESDLVVFDWRFYEPIGKRHTYNNVDTFFEERVLENNDCKRLLTINPFFTVNKLYKKSFLDDNQIRYGEGYLYEDIPFWVNVSLSSKKVSIVHSPLYRVTTHGGSSTKTNYDTDIHSRSFIKAVVESKKLLNKKGADLSEDNKYALMKYFITKFVFYYNSRTPECFKDEFLKEFVDTFTDIEFVDFKESKLISLCIDNMVFAEKKYNYFKFYIFLSAKVKPIFLRKKESFLRIIKRCRNFSESKIFKMLRIKSKPRALDQKYKEYTKQPLYNNVILFMGFDHRYTGNSRYLFEEMLKNDIGNKQIFFVTNNPLVSIEHRIEPYSDRANRFIARSKTIIFESWIPLKYEKRNGSTWIQLWHGTPLKKMLFDSNEKSIFKKNPKNKHYKFNDIQRWDYLIVDNEEIKTYFQTSFLFQNNKMLATGYPRVKYLKENKERKSYIEGVKNIYGIPNNKKVVLYLPTWRDYNYDVSNDQFDTEYLLNLGELSKKLGQEYYIVYKDHEYLSKPENVDFRNFSNAETQELLLLADYLITDYSSVMFDAFAIDIPVIIYTNDFNKNQEARGVYPDIWKDLSCYAVDNIENILNLIENYKIDDKYKYIKDKYCYRNTVGKTLSNIILDV